MVTAAVVFSSVILDYLHQHPQDMHDTESYSIYADCHKQVKHEHMYVMPAAVL